jgi:hypothetical protein
MKTMKIQELKLQHKKPILRRKLQILQWSCSCLLINSIKYWSPAKRQAFKCLQLVLIINRLSTYLLNTNSPFNWDLAIIYIWSLMFLLLLTFRFSSRNVMKVRLNFLIPWTMLSSSSSSFPMNNKWAHRNLSLNFISNLKNQEVFISKFLVPKSTILF